MTCMTLLPEAGRNGAHAARGAPGRIRRLILALAAQPGGTPEGEGLQRQSLGRSRRARSSRRRRTACALPFSSPGNGRASAHKIFRGDPRVMMRRYYDAHLYLANWGTHQIMLRLPRTLLSPKIAEQYGVDGHVGVTATPESVIPDLISEDDSGEWVEGAEDSLSAIVGVRSELAAGDLRALYLAWLSAYGGWEWDEDAFGEDDEDEREPPVPAGLGSLTAPQRALADFLRVDPDLLAVAAQASPELPEAKEDPGVLAAHIAGLPGGEPAGKRTGSSCWSGGIRRHGPRWSCCAAYGEIRMRGGSPVPGGRWPICWTRPRSSAWSAAGRLRPRPLPVRPCGNGSAKQPGKGTWTNWPRTRRPPGPRPGS